MIIGVGSVERGAGTTCVCLAFANFLCNKLGMKTAYIELNTTNQIRSLSQKNVTNSFCYFGIHMYPSTKVTSLNEILNRDFDCFILDMGVLTSYTAMEFSKCHKQFLVCDFSPWKKHLSLSKLKDLFQNSSINRENIMLLKTFENKSTGLLDLKKNTQAFPLLTNPFHLSVTEFSDLTQLLLKDTIH